MLDHMNSGDGHPKGKNILTMSLARSLNGESVGGLLEKEWQKSSKSDLERFNNFGFNVDLHNFSSSLDELRTDIEGGAPEGQAWDGLLVGWCLRGYPERTHLFEQVVEVCVDYVAKTKAEGKGETKLLFCTGPEDLYNTTIRNFP